MFKPHDRALSNQLFKNGIGIVSSHLRDELRYATITDSTNTLQFIHGSLFTQVQLVQIKMFIKDSFKFSSTPFQTFHLSRTSLHN